MEGAGSVRGIATPFISTLEVKQFRVVVHGGDFTVLGREGDLNWFRLQISDRLTVKFRGRIGPAKEDQKSMRILNRIVAWTDKGIDYEADQRHAELIQEHLGMKSDSKGVVTPGAKGISDFGAPSLDVNRAHKFRAIAARGNYLCQDRSDIQFPSRSFAER